MCLAVYLASNKPLPVIAWDEKAPAFYLEAIDEAEPVRAQFAYAHVYYAGSHEGCGCGFSKDGVADDEFEQHQQNYVALGRTVRDALDHGAELQIFTCWEGEQTNEPQSVLSVSPATLESPEYELQQLELLRVQETDA